VGFSLLPIASIVVRAEVSELDSINKWDLGKLQMELWRHRVMTS